MKALNLLLKDAIGKYEKHLTVINIILLYRYFSFLVTLVLYYFTAPPNQLINKLIIILGMILAYTTLAVQYFNNSKDKKSMMILGVVETVMNNVFIVISGGFASPFIWYFITTIFIAAVYLSNFTAIMFAITYFLTASVSTIFVLIPSNNSEEIRLYLNTAFSYILVVAGILLLIRYAVRVEEKTKCLSILNEELTNAKIKVEKTLRYSMELYETVNIFNLHSNDDILQKLLDHMKYLTGNEKLAFIRLSPSEKKGTYVSNGLVKEEEMRVVANVMGMIEKDPKNIKTRYCSFPDMDIFLNYVVYEDTPCGVFVAASDKKVVQNMVNSRAVNSDNDKEILELNSTIPIFMQIAGIILKKLEFDEMEDQLLISEEQNRIANEIHDIVLQKLFAVSCKLYILGKGDKEWKNNELKEELFGIKQSIDLTMKELREAIYGMSWEKRGEDTFINKLMKFTEEIRYLQGVDANVIIEGDTQKIRANQKHGMYRIICEAMNNAIRHGKAKHVSAIISISDTLTSIRILDDGSGFDYSKYKQMGEKGLGLNNIYRIIEMLSGQIKINTHLSGGTEIYMTVPLKPAA